MSEHLLYIGTYGWQYTIWEDEYYPEGLPPEWQLGYYGNENQVVMVPQSYWSQGETVFHEWLAETDDSPQFICEWPDVNDHDAVILVTKALDILAERIMGIVMPLVDYPSDNAIAHYQTLAARYPLSLDMGNSLRQTLTSQQQATLWDAGLGLCWHGEPEYADDLCYGRLALTRISDVADPKKLRAILESNLAQRSEPQQRVLIVDGDPPDMQLLHNTGMMLDFL